MRSKKIYMGDDRLNYNKLVSVIMPVHNGERFLREAIESVLNQTYTNFEFLIIENCSNDSSVQIINSYDDKRIRLIIEEDCGQVQAYNSGFREAKGEYIFIHDQDDISDLERFEKQIAYILENKIDICGSFISIINTNGRVIDSEKKSERHNEIKKDFFYKASVIHNSAVLIKSSTLNKLNYWDRTYFPIADSEFYYRALVSDIKFGNVPEFLYYYRTHKSQITANPTKHGTNLLTTLQLKYLAQNKSSLLLKDYYFFKSLIYYYSNSLLKALLYNCFSIKSGKCDKFIVKYFIIIVFLGLPLKFVRKYNFLNSRLFIWAKTIFAKVF